MKERSISPPKVETLKLREAMEHHRKLGQIQPIEEHQAPVIGTTSLNVKYTSLVEKWYRLIVLLNVER